MQELVLCVCVGKPCAKSNLEDNEVAGCYTLLKSYKKNLAQPKAESNSQAVENQVTKPEA